MELDIHIFYEICKHQEWIRNDRYYVKEKFTLLVSGLSERSIDNSFFAYRFTGDNRWNWLLTSCEIIRWESKSTILELSANFKGEWGHSDLQVIF